MIEENYKDNTGIIVFKNCGLANAFRRILLSEIPSVAFCTDNSTISTTDTLLTHDILKNISLVRIIEGFSGGANFDSLRDKKYYISVKSSGVQSVVLSDNILEEKTNKPAPVPQGIFICHLTKDCYLDVKNITIDCGIGREHAKWSHAYGRITYEDLDTCCVEHVNERGFLETRVVHSKGLQLPDIIDSVPMPGHSGENVQKYIIYSKSGKALMSEKTKQICKSYKEIPQREFLDTCSWESENYRIRFHSDNPKKMFAAARKLLAEQIRGKVFTITTLEVFRFYCYKECRCPVFVNRDELKFNIQHDNAERIMDNAIKAILAIVEK